MRLKIWEREVIAPVKVPSICQIDLYKSHPYSIGPYAKKNLRNNNTKTCKFPSHYAYNNGMSTRVDITLKSIKFLSLMHINLMLFNAKAVFEKD